MFQQDFIKRQIEAIGNAVAVMLFGKKKFSRIVEDENLDVDSQDLEFETDILKTLLKHSLESGNIKEGKKAIFEALKKSNSVANLIVALTFYDDVLKFDEKILKNNGYSKEQAKKDIEALRDFY